MESLSGNDVSINTEYRANDLYVPYLIDMINALILGNFETFLRSSRSNKVDGSKTRKRNPFQQFQMFPLIFFKKITHTLIMRASQQNNIYYLSGY